MMVMKAAEITGYCTSLAERALSLYNHVIAGGVRIDNGMGDQSFFMRQSTSDK